MLARVLAHHGLRALVAGVVIACVMWGGTAAADPPPADARLWLGGEFDLLLAGTIDLSANNGNTTSTDAASAIGLGGVLDYRTLPWLTFGFAPRVVFDVKPSGQNASSNQLDLRFRVTAGKEIVPRVRLYGIGTLGYSIIFDIFTDPLNGNQYNSDGFIWGLGGGISFAIRPRLLLTGELSYQWGYQGGSVGGVNFTDADNFLTLGFGVMTAID